MSKDEFVNIPLQHLPNQPTGMSCTSTNPEATEGHASRMNEFLNRPATPPPFPEDLPARPSRTGMNKWMLVSIVLLLALLAAVIPLSVLLGIAKSKAIEHTTSPATSPNQTPVMSTVTLNNTMMHTMMHTTTSISTSTLTSVLTYTWPSVSYVTITTAPPSTNPPNPSATPILPNSTPSEADLAACSSSDLPLILGRNACIMVKSCDEQIMDVPENDCKEFCKNNGGPGCACDGRERSPQMVGCCGHCGCFQ